MTTKAVPAIPKPFGLEAATRPEVISKRIEFFMMIITGNLLKKKNGESISIVLRLPAEVIH